MSIFDRIFQKKQKKSKQKRAEPPMDNPAVLLGRRLADSPPVAMDITCDQT